VRERIGKGEEEIDLPASVKTGGDLLRHLKTLGEDYAHCAGARERHPHRDQPGTCRGTTNRS
jgi:hypothetical protein